MLGLLCVGHSCRRAVVKDTAGARTSDTFLKRGVSVLFEVHRRCVNYFSRLASVQASPDHSNRLGYCADTAVVSSRSRLAFCRVGIQTKQSATVPRTQKNVHSKTYYRYPKKYHTMLRLLACTPGEKRPTKLASRLTLLSSVANTHTYSEFYTQHRRNQRCSQNRAKSSHRKHALTHPATQADFSDEQKVNARRARIVLYENNVSLGLERVRIISYNSS